MTVSNEICVGQGMTEDLIKQIIQATIKDQHNNPFAGFRAHIGMKADHLVSKDFFYDLFNKGSRYFM